MLTDFSVDWHTNVSRDQLHATEETDEWITLNGKNEFERQIEIFNHYFHCASLLISFYKWMLFQLHVAFDYPKNVRKRQRNMNREKRMK